MSGHRALVAGDNEILGRIGIRDRRATANDANYVRSYRRSVPQLVWTSWTSRVRCVTPAPVGIEYSSVKWKGTKNGQP